MPNPDGTPTLSEQINALNPDADPNKSYVQAGDTGGYLDGYGITIGPGSSITPEQRDQYLSSARAAGASDDWINNFLSENPNDYQRLTNAFLQEQNNVPAGQGVDQQTLTNTGSPTTLGTPGGGGGGGTLVPQGTNNGAAAAQSQMDALLAAIKGINTGPDVSASQLPDPGSLPVITVPGQDLGPSIDSTLQEEMAGSDPLGLKNYISSLLQNTAGGGINSQRLQSRLEGARENLTSGETAALSDLRGVLADRGLLGTPGSPQGPESDATTRALLPVEQSYLGNVRQAYQDESTAADQMQLQAIQAATGWSADEAQQRLAAADAAGNRQQMLADIAAKSLEDNMAWNEFIANFGLNREQVQEQIQSGRIDQLLPMIQLFISLANSARGGFIGNQ